MKREKYPEGHFTGQWIGIGIAIGAGMGIPLGIVIGNPGFFTIGLPIGIAIGSAIGAAKEQKAKKEGKIRPLTEKEKKERKIAVFAGIGCLIIGLIMLISIILFR